ncbi:hypothetical protein PsAD46_02719 [Pseudovibrio sp. Ad46]|uniref:DUF7946 domain-containing protein n=1 Tax=Pseudovibrio sp. Ad46 TaxID=989432 RepID=UPI0007AEAAE8|nr:hypothetical protein [Pseudovibrio sp. Ad46]KZK86333.1 hypothetical protein PsAD46_02719 [Pseudovibrio sp. Ad46]
MFSIKVRYEGGDADEHRLDLYDGTTSIQGIAQSMQIATHAFVNGKLITKAPAIKGAKLYLKPSRQGSFLADLAVHITANPETTLAVGGIFAAYTASPFYDFLKLLFRKANGLLDVEPETPAVRRALEKHEPFFDEVAEVMEGSLQRTHRPIGEGIDQISIERPRSNLITLDENTKDWVNTRETSPKDDNMSGNVTRYNAVTRNGRMYVDHLNRIIPFRLGEDFPLAVLGNLTWSLHGSNSGMGGTQELPKKLTFAAVNVLSASEKVKRVILSDCARANT